MLVIDGIKYKLWTPKDEEKEFHPMIKEHSKEIFGDNSLYFDVKHILKSKSGIGSIPDAYVISLSEPYQWYVVENELASHPVYDHIVKQLTKFINGIKVYNNRRQILETIYYIIMKDKVLRATVEKLTDSTDIYHFLSHLLSKSPRIVVFIDQKTSEVEEACQVLKYQTAIPIVEFKTFVREDAENVHAHLFEPLYVLKEITEKGIKEEIDAKIERIESEEIKILLKESLDQLKQRNCIVKPLKGRWMSVWVKGKRFMYIAARNKWFLCQIKKADGEWTDSLRIRNKKEWEDAFENYIQPIL